MKDDETKLSALKESVDTNGNYINCDFIQGTAVENESIWSMATTVLCNNQAGMTPVWFKTNFETLTDRSIMILLHRSIVE